MQSKKFHSTEFYYAEPTDVMGTEIILRDDESRHAINVMRHSVDDELNVTDGQGNIYNCNILQAEQSKTLLRVNSKLTLENNYENYKFFLPILKTSDRLEFAIEKAVELGITDFGIFSSENSYKRSVKINRWEKIAVSAMKQSLRAFKPKIDYHDSLKDLKLKNQRVIVFDQLSEKRLESANNLDKVKTNFIFGPEAGLSKNEIELFPDIMLLCLSDSRLRTETAVITAASILTSS